MFDLGLLSQSGIERIVKKRLMQGEPPFLKSSETVTEALEGSDEPKQGEKDNQPEHKTEAAKPAISILSKNRPRTTIEHVIVSIRPVWSTSRIIEHILELANRPQPGLYRSLRFQHASRSYH